jgi:hypothetical protein
MAKKAAKDKPGGPFLMNSCGDWSRNGISSFHSIDKE